jgi:hypothetical protein
MFKKLLLKLANPRIKLHHFSPELGIRRLGVAAVLFFHPFGTLEETPHLLVAGAVAEVTEDVDELVGLVVFPVPNDRGEVVLGLVVSAQAIGEQLFHGWAVFDIAFFGHIVNELGEKLYAPFFNG